MVGMMVNPPSVPQESEKGFDVLVQDEPSKKDKQIEELQEQLAHECDGRREDRFVGIVFLILLLDVVFFTVISFGGALAILVLELLILIPLAQRMGMEEVAQIISSVLNRLAGKASSHKD